MEDDERLLAALKKRALGYEASETVTEYDAEGAEIRRKVSVKDVPPDLSAIKLLLELGGAHSEPDIQTLEAERERVLALIAGYYEKKGGRNGTDEM